MFGSVCVWQGTSSRYTGLRRGIAGRLPSGASMKLPNSSPRFVEFGPSDSVCEPPPVWKRTYVPLASKFWPSPASPTSA